MEERKKEGNKEGGGREGGRKGLLYWFYLYWICNVEFRI